MKSLFSDPAAFAERWGFVGSEKLLQYWDKQIEAARNEMARQRLLEHLNKLEQSQKENKVVASLEFRAKRARTFQH